MISVTLELLSNNLITPAEKVIFEIKIRNKSELGFLSRMKQSTTLKISQSANTSMIGT